MCVFGINVVSATASDTVAEAVVVLTSPTKAKVEVESVEVASTADTLAFVATIIV